MYVIYNNRKTKRRSVWILKGYGNSIACPMSYVLIHIIYSGICEDN